jgi:hypothetical protein
MAASSWQSYPSSDEIITKLTSIESLSSMPLDIIRMIGDMSRCESLVIISGYDSNLSATPSVIAITPYHVYHTLKAGHSSSAAWQPLPSIPSARWHANAICYDQKYICVMGGDSNSRSFTQSAVLPTLPSSTWSTQYEQQLMVPILPHLSHGGALCGASALRNGHLWYCRIFNLYSLYDVLMGGWVSGAGI